MASDPAQPIVFYDGECPLCRKGVAWCQVRMPDQALRFVPLQSAEARQKLPVGWVDDVRSLALWEQGELSTHSEAVLKVVGRVRGPWRLLTGLKWIPRSLRDGIYRWIARHRMAFIPGFTGSPGAGKPGDASSSPLKVSPSIDHREHRRVAVADRLRH